MSKLTPLLFLGVSPFALSGCLWDPPPPNARMPMIETRQYEPVTTPVRPPVRRPSTITEMEEETEVVEPPLSPGSGGWDG